MCGHVFGSNIQGPENVPVCGGLVKLIAPESAAQHNWLVVEPSNLEVYTHDNVILFAAPAEPVVVKIVYSAINFTEQTHVITLREVVVGGIIPDNPKDDPPEEPIPDGEVARLLKVLDTRLATLQSGKPYTAMVRKIFLDVLQQPRENNMDVFFRARASLTSKLQSSASRDDWDAVLDPVHSILSLLADEQVDVFNEAVTLVANRICPACNL